MCAFIYIDIYEYNIMCPGQWNASERLVACI